MKKRLTKLLFAVCSISILGVVLAGCASTNVKDITKFADKIAEAKSYTMVMTLTSGEGDSAKSDESIVKVSGDKMYMKSPEMADEAAGESYIEIKDGKVYTYYKEGETWKKSEGISVPEGEKNSIDESKASIKAMLDADKFEYSKDKKAFVLKSGSSLGGGMEGFEGLTMTIKGGELQINMSMDIIGTKTAASIIIKSINSTSISLPKVG